MKELILSDSTTKRMSSREVALITGKEHKNVLRTIKQVVESDIDKVGLIYELNSYVAENGKSNPEYLFDKNTSLFFIAKIDNNFLMAVINRWQELEAKPTPSYQIENPAERARAWAVEYEEKLLLQETNAKLQYRSDFVDVCFDTDGVFSMEETCKILKLPYGRNTMLQKLRELKVFLKSNTPSQKFISNGYFKVVENIIENGEFKKLISTTYATQKGIGYIHKLLNN